MNLLNQFIMEGVCAEDVEVTLTPTGSKVAMIKVSVERNYRRNDGTLENELYVFDIEGYGASAEVMGKLCKKGVCVRIVGRLAQKRWKTTDGKSCSKVVGIAEHVDFKKGKTEEETDESRTF